MNKRLQNPVRCQFLPATDDKKVVQNDTNLYIPENAKYSDLLKQLKAVTKGAGFINVHFNSRLNLDDKDVITNLGIKMNAIYQVAKDAKLPVMNYYKQTWYLLNPDYQSKSELYAPSDDQVLDKYHNYASNDDWQEHQSQIWKRMSGLMPLSDTNQYGNIDHISLLTDPKRGLDLEDLTDFWSFKSGRTVIPGLLGDDMVGMPSVNGKMYDGFTICDKDGSERPAMVIGLKTTGLNGYMIPMANPNGHIAKWQIGADPSVINICLKARAADGISIAHSEYFDKKKQTYQFTFGDGTPSNLHVTKVENGSMVTFADIKGSFTANMKEDVKDVLTKRGYALPSLISQLKVEPASKYIWQSPGSMTGSTKVKDLVTPSEAGFVTCREPKNGADDYTLLVVEGALKGRIVAKYGTVVDQTGASFGDKLAGDRGIIVAQVSGVAESFVKSVGRIYEKKPIANTIIAMDADGRTNYNVANGIHKAEACLQKQNPTSILSWDPKCKGLDDALLAIAQKKLTIADLDLKQGSADELFPLSDAKRPNPYNLDGTRKNRPDYLLNADISRLTREEKIAAAQMSTQEKEAITRAEGELKRRADGRQEALQGSKEAAMSKALETAMDETRKAESKVKAANPFQK